MTLGSLTVHQGQFEPPQTLGRLLEIRMKRPMLQKKNPYIVVFPSVRDFDYYTPQWSTEYFAPVPFPLGAARIPRGLSSPAPKVAVSVVVVVFV